MTKNQTFLTKDPVKPFYRNYVVTLVLLCLSSYFVSGFKLYFWTLSHSLVGFGLETISALMALGGAFGFFLGPILVDKFGIRLTSFLSMALCVIGMAFGLYARDSAYAFFVIGASIVGMGGSLWLVTKNVLLPLAIGETQYSDTLVSGIANVVFTIFTIVGTIAGSYFAEKFSIPGSIGLLLALAAALPLTPLFREHTETRKISSGYVTSIVRVVREYFPYIISIALLWAVITALAQVFVEAGVDYFGESHTRASLLLLWATLGGVIGNVLSIRWQSTRWKTYRASLVTFGLLVFASIPLIRMFSAMDNIAAFSVLAACIGFFFGIAVNLVEGYYFFRLEFSPLKSYGAAVYGLVASLSIFIVMHLVLIVKAYSGAASLLLSGCLILLLVLLSLGKSFEQQE